MVASKYAQVEPMPSQIDDMDTWLQQNYGKGTLSPFSTYYINSQNLEPPLGDLGSATEPPELVALARNFFKLPKATYYPNWTLTDLEQTLAEGYPVIVRVRPQMKVGSATAHYMVVLGIDAQAPGESYETYVPLARSRLNLLFSEIVEFREVIASMGRQDEEMPIAV